MAGYSPFPLVFWSSSSPLQNHKIFAIKGRVQPTFSFPLFGQFFVLPSIGSTTLKGPKVLKYSWEELTGLEELDSDEMEKFRLMWRAINDCFTVDLIRSLLERNCTHVLSRPTCDLNVVLYRLLEDQSRLLLNTFTAISGSVIASSNDDSMSFGQFMSLIEDSFVFSKRPMPIVSGDVPEVWL